jgi:hypothetical protein
MEASGEGEGGAEVEAQSARAAVTTVGERYRLVRVEYTYSVKSALPPLPAAAAAAAGEERVAQKSLSWQEYRSAAGAGATVSGWRQLRQSKAEVDAAAAVGGRGDQGAGRGARGGMVGWLQVRR